MQPVDNFRNLVFPVEIEIRARLVEHEDLRVLRHSPCDKGLLLLALRQCAESPVDQVVAAQLSQTLLRSRSVVAAGSFPLNGGQADLRMQQ